ncbi:OmpA family protein [uncultured Cytophaga sp.]|uniref:OmpA family protein n=1 Tax=uncultured Cytophaga sp. TaxID=160238 RepID=UPI00262FF09F|nr:OmpA family protein [uncultured Cytophaga sp.]
MTRFIKAIFILGLAVATACSPKSAKYFAKAEVQYTQAEYQDAIENYQQALSEGGDPAQCNYRIAECYRRSNRIQEAEPFYKKAVEAGVKDEEAYFFYGKAMQSVGNYEGAAAEYKKYIKNGSNFDLINRAKKELENLTALQAIVEEKNYYKVSNISALNTSEAEYAPFFFKDKLYFTTSRDAEKMHSATGTGFTNIYEFVFDNVEQFTGQAMPIAGDINTDGAHEASCIFTKDGKTMIFARGNTGAKKGPKDVDLYKTTLDADGKWTEPVMLAISDDKAWDACPAFSLDEKTLFFASNRDADGALGNVDIYKATLDENGEWSNPVNVGAPINTRGNDMYPNVASDGTFYFSSDGHPSLGSLDVFYIKNEGGKLNIKNIGQPINTSYDDFGLVWKDSLTGYFTSNRVTDGAQGDDDIYEVKNTYWDRTATYTVDGTVFGKNKKNPQYILPNALVYLLNCKGDTLKTVVADSEAKFQFQLKPDSCYYIAAQMDKYFAMPKSEWAKVTIPTVPLKKLEIGENEIKKSAVVLLVKKERIIIVRNILYDYDKWNIRPDAAVELDTMVMLMKDNPEINIELGSHTDERGAAEYNRVLAQKRAQAAVDYMVNHGIEKSRIIAKGYGEDEPAIRGAKTEAEHQTNRRTTFKVLNHFSDDVEIQQK